MTIIVEQLYQIYINVINIFVINIKYKTNSSITENELIKYYSHIINNALQM